MSSKYDSAQILISSSSSSSSTTASNPHSSSYVLSRLAIARLLSFIEIDSVSATKAALAVKKSLVDSNELVINHRLLFQKVLEALHDMEIRIPDNDARLIAQYWRLRPLVIVIVKRQEKEITTICDDEKNQDPNGNLLLAISQRLCDCAVLDTNLLLGVDDVVARMFPSSSSSSPSSTSTSSSEKKSTELHRQSVTSSICSETCRAFSRGGSLVVSGPKEYFDNNHVIANKLREGLLSVGINKNVIPTCVVFAEEQSNNLPSNDDEYQQKTLFKTGSCVRTLEAPLQGECLEIGLHQTEAQTKKKDGGDTSIAKTVVAAVRESLSRTLQLPQ